MEKNKRPKSLYLYCITSLGMLLASCSYEGKPPEVSFVYDTLSADRTLISGMMINGKKYGVWHSYYENGQIMSFETYVNDTLNGPRIAYREENNIGSISQYKNGLEDGEWRLYYWYPDKVAWKRYFSNGKKVGVWESYYEDGRLELRVEYDENEKEKVLVDNTIPIPGYSE